MPTRLVFLSILLQTPMRITGEHEPVPGVGSIETLDRALVLSDGTWLAQAVTDHPSPFRDGVVVRTGIPILREGDTLPSPEGANLRSFGSWEVDRAGNLLWELTMTGSGIAEEDRQGLFWNTRLLAREAHQVQFPGHPEAWTWHRFGARHFGPGDELWITASIRDPARRNPLTMLLRGIAPQDGIVRAFEPVVTPGDALPGLGTLRAVELAACTLSCNRQGQVLWSGKREAPVESDGFLALGDSSSTPLAHLVALEGEKAPVGTRRFGSFHRQPSCLNDSGQFAFRCTLQSDPLSPAEIASDELLVLNGVKLVQEGDYMSSLGGLLDESPSSNLELSNAGELYWMARLRDVHDDHDEAYMEGHRVLIREGLTLIEGDRVIGLARSEGAFGLDPGGRFFFALVKLQAAGQSLIVIDLGSIEPVIGCGSSAAILYNTNSRAVAGGRLRLAMDGAQEVGARSFFLVSGGLRAPKDGCGTPTPFGELLISNRITAPIAGGLWVHGPTLSEIPLPLEIGLVDSVWYVQGVFASANPRVEPLRLANGLRLELGAP